MHCYSMSDIIPIIIINFVYYATYSLFPISHTTCIFFMWYHAGLTNLNYPQLESYFTSDIMVIVCYVNNRYDNIIQLYPIFTMRPILQC